MTLVPDAGKLREHAEQIRSRTHEQAHLSSLQAFWQQLHDFPWHYESLTGSDRENARALLWRYRYYSELTPEHNEMFRKFENYHGAANRTWLTRAEFDAQYSLPSFPQ